MSLLPRIRSWLRSNVRRADLERGLHEELRFHIDRYAEDLMRQGLAPEEATRRARAEFGSLSARKDECREALGLRLVDEIRGDLRYALRLLRRSPAFTAVAVLSLGVGIGANTAIFSFVDTVLLKALPIRQPERLFFVDNSGGKSGGSNAPPYPCYQILRDHNRYISSMAAFDFARFKVTIDGVDEQISGQYASGSYFDVLGVPAAYGRVLTLADDQETGGGGPDGPVAVISHGLWKRRFGMSPSVLGKTIRVAHNSVTIVGVTPPEFFGLEVGSPVDVTVPLTLSGKNLRERSSWWFSVVARLKDDAGVEEARADLDGMFQTYMADNGVAGENRKYFDRIVLVPASKGLNGLRRQFSEPLWLVMAIVGLVLLVGCANVANLLLARATARRTEISVRLAIGASRSRLIRQMLTEGALLAALGAGVGVLLARWGATLLAGFVAGVHGWILLDPQFDLRILGFTAALAVLTAFLFSTVPAIYSTRGDAAKPGDSGRASSTRPRLRVGQALIVIQVTLSLVLLSGAALFVRTLRNLNTLDAGFVRTGVLTMRVDAVLTRPRTPADMPAAARDERARIARIWEDLIARLHALPGVESAAAATLSPLDGSDRHVTVMVEGDPPGVGRDKGIHVNQVTSRYVETLGIAASAGRVFTDLDQPGSPKVAILNRTAARGFFGDEQAVGKRIRFFPGHRLSDAYEIVGVVHDTRYETLRAAPEPMVYLPIQQPIDRIAGVMVAIRGPARVIDTSGFLAAVRHDVGLTVPGGFVSNVATIAQQVEESLVQERLVSMVASFFAGLALLLACIGLYGVMSYAVVSRTREIGIRLAIGCPPGSVMWLMLRDSVVLIAIGLALGLSTVIAVSRYVESQLFGVAPRDPVAIATAILVLTSVGIAAGYVPAWRASRIAPTIALRTE